MGCSAEDLCASGWHICTDQADFSLSSGNCSELVSDLPTFYATAQGSAGSNICDGNGANDIFGCGRACGAPTSQCGSLDRVLTSMTPLAGWDLGSIDTAERDNVSKAEGSGGVLCCRGPQ